MENLGLTESEFDDLYERGYRCYEIYIKNPNKVEYYGKTHKAGTIGGWSIRFIFSTREKLESFPFFDAVIGIDSASVAECVWHGWES